MRSAEASSAGDGFARHIVDVAGKGGNALNEVGPRVGGPDTEHRRWNDNGCPGPTVAGWDQTWGEILGLDEGQGTTDNRSCVHLKKMLSDIDVEGVQTVRGSSNDHWRWAAVRPLHR